MRSAQMAQKAQLAPQLASIPQDPYQQYVPYQMYQQMEMQPPYAPFAVYNPVYRGQPPVMTPPFQAARPAPMQYHPIVYYQHSQAGQPQLPPIRKKSARN